MEAEPAPTVLEAKDYGRIEVGDDDFVSIAGLYPIHDVERRWIDENGAVDFWLSSWDEFDVGRPPAVG